MRPGFRAALHVEVLKLRRSVVPAATALAFGLAPLVGGFFMYVIADPDRAQRLGLIGQKAALAGDSADWATYLAFLASAVTVGGFILFSFLAAWMFGREFADGAVRYLLALPTSRSAIVAAKLVLVVVWGAVLVAMVTVLGLIIGAGLGLTGWSPKVLLEGLVTIWAGAGLTLLVIAPVALLAGVGHGYLVPLAFTMLVLLFAQVVAVTGRGAYFPWAIPSLFAQVAGTAGGLLTPISFVIVALTGVAGAVATFVWWSRADFSR